jgi:hypothetical protein
LSQEENGYKIFSFYSSIIPSWKKTFNL